METTLTDDLYDPGCVFSLAWLPAGKVVKLDSLCGMSRNAPLRCVTCQKRWMLSNVMSFHHLHHRNLTQLGVVVAWEAAKYDCEFFLHISSSICVYLPPSLQRKKKRGESLSLE